MANYTYAEQVDMILTLGECFGSANAAVRRYAEKFPARNIPNRKTFLKIEQRLRENGSFKIKNVDAGRPRSARTVEIEEQILETVFHQPTISTRRLALRTNTSHASAFRVLKEQQLHPYHFRQVQHLLPEDRPSRVDFCELLLEREGMDRHFLNKILFTDEATFTRAGVFNYHNCHFWSDENPRVTRVSHYQHDFKINVWVATLGNELIGFHMFPGSLNGNMYTDFLENNLFQILENVPLNLRREMFFMHDGAPPHFSRTARQWLNINFPNKWIGRGADAPIHWPARSPDMNPVDFNIWGYLKAKVYEDEINTVEELRGKIINECTLLQNNRQVLNRLIFNLNQRINLCIHENGGHFEHLL